MNWISSSIILLTIFQFLICNNLPMFLLLVLIALGARGLFMLRMIGVKMKIKPLFIAEGFATIALLLIGLLSKNKFSILVFILYVLITVSVCILELLDNHLYMYITEDYRSED